MYKDVTSNEEKAILFIKVKLYISDMHHNDSI